MKASFEEMLNTPADVIFRDLEYNDTESTAKALHQQEINTKE